MTLENIFQICRTFLLVYWFGKPGSQVTNNFIR